jgi:nucleoside-diphosphate-sugar epimerase
LSLQELAKTVLVTGATGYVAGWLVKKLLDEGHTVHAAVRHPDRVEKIAHLQRLAENAPGEIRFFKADLLTKGSYAAAMENCEIVFHTASPFTTAVKDPQRELVDPAKLGTRNVLEQANATASVQRVVLTSSCAAIYGDNIDLENTPNGEFTEEIWNTTSSLTHQPYSFSKTEAEKEAWRIADEQQRWRLVVVNPSLVIGPALNPKTNTSESFVLLKQMGDGTLKSGVPRYGFGVVDVRDLAEAHYQAAIRPAAQGRHIISAHNTFFIEMAAALQEKYGKDYPIPRRETPKWLVWLLGPMINSALQRKVIARNVGYPWIGNNSKSVNELGLAYRSLSESMNDTFQQLIDEGLVKK